MWHKTVNNAYSYLFLLTGKARLQICYGGCRAAIRGEGSVRSVEDTIGLLPCKHRRIGEYEQITQTKITNLTKSSCVHIEHFSTRNVV